MLQRLCYALFRMRPFENITCPIHYDCFALNLFTRGVLTMLTC